MKIPALIVATFLALGQSNLKPDPPHACADCEAWNKEVPPSRVFGNTYFVGTDGLSSVLIVSNAGSSFRFSGDTTHPSLVPAFRKSIDVVRKLPCDVIISVHPTRPFIKPDGCRAYADGAEKRLDARIAEEQKSR